MKTFLVFSTQFLRCLVQVRGVIIGLLLLILGGSVLVSFVENISLGESIYFSFITALTVGYGDLTPATPIGRFLSICIGVIGMIFFGVIIGISTRIIIRQMHPEEFKKIELETK